MRRILIAGFGSVLRGDDGFGPAVIRQLAATELPANVETLDAGAGGIDLVMHLLEHFDELIVVDAIRRGGDPGTIYEFEPSAVDAERDADKRLDAHSTDPGSAMRLAAQLKVLPASVKILGCEPASFDFTQALSSPVQKAVERAVARVREITSTQEGQREWRR